MSRAEERTEWRFACLIVSSLLFAALAVAVVVVSSAIFAALKDELLGHEDPHWHKSKEPALAATE